MLLLLLLLLLLLSDDSDPNMSPPFSATMRCSIPGVQVYALLWAFVAANKFFVPNANFPSVVQPGLEPMQMQVHTLRFTVI